MDLENDLVVQCEMCGHINFIDRNSLDINSHTYERNMGTEVEYIFTGESFCKSCNNQMFYRIYGYEYPVGAYNYHSHEESGCHFVWEPSVEVECYEFELSEFDESIISESVDNIQQLIDDVLLDPSAVFRMQPDEFENMVASIFERNGYDVKVTPKTRDGGKDIIATYNMGGIPCVLYVECKRYNKEHPVGIKIVREVFGVLSSDKVNKAVIVSTSSFSKEARRFAGDQKSLIELIDLEELLKMVHQ